MQATKVEITVNLKRPKRSASTPLPLVGRADEVIE